MFLNTALASVPARIFFGLRGGAGAAKISYTSAIFRIPINSDTKNRMPQIVDDVSQR